MVLVRVLRALSLCLALNSASALLHVQAATPKKKAAPKKKTYARRKATTVISGATRAAALQAVQAKMDEPAPTFVENPQALLAFFEQLRRLERGEWSGVLPVMQFGDSHTASDDWTHALRSAFQQRFGDGGGGFSTPGLINGLRRFDLKRGNSVGWSTQGLLSPSSDGLHGIAGVSLATSRAGEAAYVSTGAARVEVQFLRQPGGGSFALLEDGRAVETISTDGPLGFGYFEHRVKSPVDRFEVQTVDDLPVRLLGWVTEKPTGVTVEPLGINGAQATIFTQWDHAVLSSQVTRRNPALIILAYGSNETASPKWDYDSYKHALGAILKTLRTAAPAASILVAGPPDRMVRTRTGFMTHTRLDAIVEAQREAARANNCAFWDLRTRMGGGGAMQRWVLAGAAQYDYLHFTSPGYRLIGATLFNDLMDAYVAYQRARDRIFSASAGGAHSTDHDQPR